MEERKDHTSSVATETQPTINGLSGVVEKVEEVGGKMEVRREP